MLCLIRLIINVFAEITLPAHCDIVMVWEPKIVQTVVVVSGLVTGKEAGLLLLNKGSYNHQDSYDQNNTAAGGSARRYFSFSVDHMMFCFHLRQIRILVNYVSNNNLLLISSICVVCLIITFITLLTHLYVFWIFCWSHLLTQYWVCLRHNWLWKPLWFLFLNLLNLCKIFHLVE